MTDRMTLEEYHEMNRTGKLPKRLRQKTRMEVIADVAETDPALAEQAANVPKRNKFGAIKVEDDGFTFDSKKEHRRYLELKAFQAAGTITNLEVHPPTYPLEVNGIKISEYTADFCYLDSDTGDLVVEDVKGGSSTKTRAYVMRRKLMKALYGIDIKEV